MVAFHIQGEEDSDDTIPTQTSLMVPKLSGRQYELDIMKQVLDIDDSTNDNFGLTSNRSIPCK